MDNIPRDSVHFVFIDELKENPGLCFETLLTFLGVSRVILPSYEVINAKKEKIVPGLSEVFSFVNRLKVYLGVRAGLGIANYLVRKNRRKPRDKYLEEYVSMKPMLLNEFFEDILLLERITGKDLTSWKQ